SPRQRTLKLNRGKNRGLQHPLDRGIRVSGARDAGGWLHELGGFRKRIRPLRREKRLGTRDGWQKGKGNLPMSYHLADIPVEQIVSDEMGGQPARRLLESMARYGLFQPILVRARKDGRYDLGA